MGFLPSGAGASLVPVWRLMRLGLSPVTVFPAKRPGACTDLAAALIQSSLQPVYALSTAGNRSNWIRRPQTPGTSTTRRVMLCEKKMVWVGQWKNGRFRGKLSASQVNCRSAQKTKGKRPPPNSTNSLLHKVPRGRTHSGLGAAQPSRSARGRYAERLICIICMRLITSHALHQFSLGLKIRCMDRSRRS